MRGPDPNDKPLCVWLVEDNLTFRETVARLVREVAGLETMEFSRCEDALDALAQDIVPDVVLMDIGLPGVDGISGVGHIKRVSPATHVVMLTVSGEDEAVFRAICAGASGYLLKSASASEILKAVYGVCRGTAPIDGHVARKILDMFAAVVRPTGDYRLTDREKQILKLLVEGETKKEIAGRLFVSHHTIDTHVRNIYEKLHVHSRGGVVAAALRAGLVRD